MRAGVATDQTPTVSELRSSRVPDGDRTWLAAGASMRLSDSMEVGLSCAHVRVTPEQRARADRL